MFIGLFVPLLNAADKMQITVVLRISDPYGFAEFENDTTLLQEVQLRLFLMMLYRMILWPDSK